MRVVSKIFTRQADGWDESWHAEATNAYKPDPYVCSDELCRVFPKLPKTATKIKLTVSEFKPIVPHDRAKQLTFNIMPSKITWIESQVILRNSHRIDLDDSIVDILKYIVGTKIRRAWVSYEVLDYDEKARYSHPRYFPRGY